MQHHNMIHQGAAAAANVGGRSNGVRSGTNDLVIQVMHINQRIKIRLPDTESYALFLHKLCVYFEITNERNSSQLGLFERRGPNEYVFMRDRSEIKHDRLYYLYFREKPDKNLMYNSQDKTSDERNLEEVKHDSFGNNASKGSWGQHNQSHNTKGSTTANGARASINLASSQIEKVKRPKEEKKVLICPFEKCLKEFSETGNLKTHMRTHTGERPFVCIQCDQQFITKGHLQAHELTHTGEKPFVCPHPGCTKRYSRAGRLKIHQRLHTGERPFICQMDGCEKAFREKGNLLTHMRIHNGQKPFKCDFADCDMSFTTQGHLTDHKRRHSGERPYNCDVCKDKFMRSSTLKIHMRRHTGEKPYKCEKCERAFSESGNLRTHLKIHEDETSSVGKRSRRHYGGMSSRFSSAVVTPVSNRRTLKVTSKRLEVLNQQGKAKIPIIDSDLRPVETSPRANEDDQSPPPLNLKEMPEIQLDFINAQRSNKLPPEPQSNIADEGTMRRRRKLTDGSQQSREAVPNTSKAQQLTLKIEATQIENGDGKDEEIKLPIVKNENAGPPGMPQQEAVFNQQFNIGSTTQRFDPFSQITPIGTQNFTQHFGALANFPGGFETPFNMPQTQAGFQNQLQYQQQQQMQMQNLANQANQSQMGASANPNFPFSPTAMIGNLNASAFSPRQQNQMLQNQFANNSANPLFLNTPTAGLDSNFNSIKRNGIMNKGGAAGMNLPGSFMGQVTGLKQDPFNNKGFGNLNQMQQQQLLNQINNQKLGGFNNSFSPQGQTFNLESPDVQNVSHQNMNGNLLAAQNILGSMQKIGDSTTNPLITFAQGLSNFPQPSRFPFNNNTDQSPVGQQFFNQQRKANPLQGLQQPQAQLQQVAFSNLQNNSQLQKQPQLINQASFSQALSSQQQHLNFQNQVNPTPNSDGRGATSSGRNHSSQSRSGGGMGQADNLEDHHSFSNLAARYQQVSNNPNGSAPSMSAHHQSTFNQNSHCSPESSPNIIIKSERQNMATADQIGQNFSTLANVATQNRLLGTNINISENSAFRKSPRVGGNQLQNQAKFPLQGGLNLSASNTPRVFGSTTTTVSDLQNPKLLQHQKKLTQQQMQNGLHVQQNQGSGNFIPSQQHLTIDQQHHLLQLQQYSQQGKLPTFSQQANFASTLRIGSPILGGIGASNTNNIPNNQTTFFDDANSPHIGGGGNNNTQLPTQMQKMLAVRGAMQIQNESHQQSQL